MSLEFYTDTHITKQVAVQLRKRGVDVVLCEEVGLMAVVTGVEYTEIVETELEKFKAKIAARQRGPSTTPD
jgi:hypothetical protein